VVAFWNQVFFFFFLFLFFSRLFLAGFLIPLLCEHDEISYMVVSLDDGLKRFFFYFVMSGVFEFEFTHCIRPH
jgi:hypothetical protein